VLLVSHVFHVLMTHLEKDVIALSVNNVRTIAWIASNARSVLNAGAKNAMPNVEIASLVSHAYPVSSIQMIQSVTNAKNAKNASLVHPAHPAGCNLLKQSKCK